MHCCHPGCVWFFRDEEHNLAMKKFYVLSALLLMAVVANAQSLRLQLFDKNNSETIPFAYVHLLSQTGSILNTVQTDENGVATLIPSQYPATIEINALGFENAKKHFQIPPTNTNITLYLVKKFSTLNEVVITGTNTPVRQKDALSVYKIITREQIQAQGAVSLDEVMRNQLNVTVGNDGILGTSMDMQSLGSDKVKILIDGLPVNGREGNFVNLSQMLLQNVDRIEMIQGPMSIAYGSDALGGVINIITKNEKKPYSVNVGSQYESIGRINADLSLTKRFNKRHQGTIGVGRNQFLGWEKYGGDTLRSGNEYNYMKRAYTFKPNEQYMANIGYTYTAPSGFNLRFASDYLNEKVTNKGNLYKWDPYDGAYAEDQYYYTQRSMNRLSLNGKIGKKGTWQSQNGLMYYKRIRATYIKDMVNLTETLSNANGVQDTSIFTDVFARGSYSNEAGRFSYTVGYDINLQYATSLKIGSRNQDQQDYAAYTTLGYDLLKNKIKIQGGLRAAYNTVYNVPVLPNVNILFTPSKNIQIRASYSEGYRAPTLKELYLSFIDVNHEILGNQNLKPESSRHLQLSGSYQVYEKNNDYLQITLTGYYNNVHNLIALANLEPDNPRSIKFGYSNLYHRQNTLATLQTDGHHGNLHYQAGVTASYTFAEPGQFDAFSSTEANAVLQYTWKKPGIGFNTFYKITGRRPFLQSNIDGTASYNGTQATFHMVDLSIEKKFFERKLQIVAGVKNLLDFQRPTITGGSTSSGGAHGGGGATAGFMPRSFFTSLRLSIN